MTCIYADVLFITNIYFTYFFLKTTCVLFHLSLKGKRLAFASCLGGAASLLILLPAADAVITLFKILSVPLIILAAGFSKSISKIIKYSLIFIIINVCFAGICMAFWKISGGKIVYVKNFTVYFNISLIMLLGLTIVFYILITVADSFLIKRKSLASCYYVSFSIDGDTMTFEGTADTGNSLYDYFTGRPVVVCLSKLLNEKYCKNIPGSLPEGFRLMPYKTIDGESMIMVRSCDSILIKDESGSVQSIRGCIGIADRFDEKDRAIFNPNILR